MSPHRGFRHLFLGKRQGLGGVLGGLVPGITTSSAAKQSTTSSTVSQSQSTGGPSGIGEIIGAITSFIDGIPTVIFPSSGPSSATTTSAPLTYSSSSSTGSTAAPTSAQTTTLASSTTSTSTSTTPTPTPTSTSSGADIVYTTSDGTRIVYITSTLPTPSATAGPTPSFSRNPSLQGGVFALVGIVVLVIIFIAITYALRKRRRNRLERDLAAAITFDPGSTDLYERQESSAEKRRLSGSSMGHGHGYGYGVQPAYASSQEYRGPMDYGRYPAVAAYNAPSAHTVPYRPPSPTVSQPAGQGGANLTRKFSDRKPVPPLLPNPVYNPSNAHVSIPPQFYQQ